MNQSNLIKRIGYLEEKQAKLEKDIENYIQQSAFEFRAALADAIMRPAGVIPKSCEKYKLTAIELNAADERKKQK